MSVWPHFLRPEWLWALLLLPLVLAGWFWIRREGVWRGIVDPHLLPALLGPARPARRALPAALLGLLFGLGVIALAGPSWQQRPVERLRLEAPLVLAVELSSAMRAADLPPGRLMRVRLKLAQLLSLREDGQLALVAYAGDAFTVTPLTEDAATVRVLLDALDPSIMPVDGQRAERAIAHAVALIEQAGDAGGDILLVASALEDPAAARAAAAEALVRGHRISVLGVGTPEGAPLPRTDGGFQTDVAGRVRLARLDESGLRALAAAGGGRYVRIASEPEDLYSLNVLSPRARAPAIAQSDARRQAWHDQGYWLLPAVMLLFLFALRRGALPAVALLALGLTLPAAQAADETPAERIWTWWSRADQQAWRLLQEGQADAARRLAQDPELAGAAAYREQDWDAALSAWADRSGARPAYNRGNALARAGRYAEAIEAYEAALAEQPDHEDAAANLQAVRDWLESQPQASQGGEGESEPQEGDSEPGQSEPGEAGEPGEGQADGSRPDASQAQEPQEGEDPGNRQDGEAESPPDAAETSAEDQAAAEQALREALEQALQAQRDAADADGAEEVPLDPQALAEWEQRQALEQWLRRVPDDPGGLLRRKFALEYQRRMMEEGRR